MQLYATAHASGHAVRLRWTIPEGTSPLIVSTRASTPPTNPLALPPTDARTIVTSATRTTDSNNPRAIKELNPGRWRQYHDLGPIQKKDAGPNFDAPLTYHLYAIPTSGARQGPISVTVDASDARRAADSPIIRDYLATRLRWHLRRGVTNGTIIPQAGFVPVLEQESLAQDDPVPFVLQKEMWTENGNETIGKFRGKFRDLGNGKGYNDYTSRYRVRVDLLAVSDNPTERSDLAKLIFDGLEADKSLFQDIGLSEVTLSRSMTSGETPDGRIQFGEEITLTGNIDVVISENVLYTMQDDPDLNATTY